MIARFRHWKAMFITEIFTILDLTIANTKRSKSYEETKNNTINHEDQQAL